MPDGSLESLVVNFHKATGHLGRDKAWMAIRTRYHNFNLCEIVAKIIRKCTICLSFKGRSRGGAPQVCRRAHALFQKYAIDLLQLEPSRGNIKYLLVGVDVYARFMSAIPIKDKRSTTVSTAFEDYILPTLMRIPEVVITDNGPELRGNDFKDILARYSIEHYTRVPYLPQTNGRIECVDKTLQLMLATAFAESGKEWAQELPRSIITYNHSVHSQTGLAPAGYFSENVSIPVPIKTTWKKASQQFKPYRQRDLVGYKLPEYKK